MSTYELKLRISDCTVRIRDHEDTASTVTVSMVVKDPVNGQPNEISRSERFIWWKLWTHQERDAQVMAICEWLVRHELAETLLRGGMPIVAPHPPNLPPYPDTMFWRDDASGTYRNDIQEREERKP